jgi:hypothetical protein
VKEINHRDKVIRLHSGYDSGKGTRYVPPVIVPKRQRIDLRIAEILSKQNSNALKLVEQGKRFWSKYNCCLFPE